MNWTDLSDTSGSLAPEELGKLQTSQVSALLPGQFSFFIFLTKKEF